MPASSHFPNNSPQKKLRDACASQSIELQFWQQPEFRLELADGKFLVGGTLEGSRWLLKEALIGWGLEAAIAFASKENHMGQDLKNAWFSIGSTLIARS